MSRSLQNITKGISRRSQRALKKVWQQVFLKKSGDAKLALVLGCQRSGTSMLIELLGRSRQVFSYGEMDPPIMNRDCRLAGDAVIRKELANSTAAVIAIKPICDSQWADQLLERYPETRVVWIYRHYNDVINSSIKKFSGQFERMEWFANEDWERLSWRAERIEKDHKIVRLMRRLYKEGSNREDATALMWALRNGLFFDFELDRHPRVKLIKYESLVQDPEQQVREVCAFLGIQFDARLVLGIHAESVSKSPAPKLHIEVADICERIQANFDRVVESKQSLRHLQEEQL